jgi:hypothetical protein
MRRLGALCADLGLAAAVLCVYDAGLVAAYLVWWGPG